MRRRLLTAVGITALTLAVPSAALAHHDGGRHHRHHHHHKLRAKAHHAKFRIEHIGAGAGGPNVTPPAPTPPTTPPIPENAGTVTAYTGGVLTLTLNDGSTVSGRVTARTRFRCIEPTPTVSPGSAGQPTDQSSGDDAGPRDNHGPGDKQEGDDVGRGRDQGSSGWQHGDHGDDNDEDDAPGASEPPCDSSALVSGAAVRAAELRIGPGGTEFETIVLVR